MAEIKIAAAYIRVSTEDQIEYSPDAQLAEIRRYAAAHNYILPEEYIYVDEGISGRGTAKRENFNRMIGIAKTKPKPFDAILLWKFSRFARNREDSIVYKSMLRKQLGIDVVSITEPVGDDKMSILIEALIEAMDEYYSINLAEEVRRGMTEKARRGGLQATPSFGYTVSKGENKLIVVPEEAEIIKEVFARFVNGDTILGIARSLNARGVRTHRGNKLEGRTIDYFLHNPVYIGMLRWNPTGKTKRTHWNDENIIISPGEHEPIIDIDTWNKAQERSNYLKSKYKYKEHSPTLKSHWLIGVLRCASCGATLILAQNKWFKCANYCRGSCDTSQHINAKIIENALIEKLKYDADHPLGLSFSVQRRNIIDSSAIQNAKDAIAKIGKKKERLRDAYLAGIDSVEDYKRLRQELDAEEAKLLEELQQLDKPQSTESAEEQLSKAIKDALKIITSDDADNSTKFDAATDIIENCVWNKSTGLLTINYRLYI